MQQKEAGPVCHFREHKLYLVNDIIKIQSQEPQSQTGHFHVMLSYVYAGVEPETSSPLISMELGTTFHKGYTKRGL